VNHCLTAVRGKVIMSAYASYLFITPVLFIVIIRQWAFEESIIICRYLNSVNKSRLTL